MGEVRVRVVAVASIPRLGFQAHFGVMQSALMPFGIVVNWGQGAFWGQTMQRLFEDTLAGGNVDWILTIDYDTMFTAHHLGELIQHMASNPDIDALAPLQVRRLHDTALAYLGAESVRLSRGELIRSQNAHFGLTLIKAEKLAELPKPWFLETPDLTGGYGDGRTDADIHFWRIWERAGNTCFIDTGVRVGHLEEDVRVHDEEMRVKLMTVEQWREMERGRSEGKALGARPATEEE